MATTLANDESVFRTRDLIALGAALVAFFFATQSSADTSLRLKWYIELEAQSNVGSQITIEPLVTDLDGDGQGEVLFISGQSSTLKVYSLADKRDDLFDETPVSLKLQKEVDILSGLRFASGRRAVALGCGYLEPFSSNTRRHQHVVVVRQDWTVILMDHLFNVVWETPVGAHINELVGKHRNNYELQDVAILVTSQSASRDVDSGGMVVVTGRMKRKMVERTESEPVLNEEDEAALTRLSFFAIEGGTGAVAWQHLGGSLKSGSDQVEPQHQYRLDPSSMRTGDDWTAFRSSLLASLPHSWESAADTKVELAHYTRQHSGGRHHAAKRKGSLLGGHGGHGHPSVRLPGLSTVPISASKPHQESEHIEAPNVLVAHSEEGVEVVLLRGGGEVLSLALPKGGVYFDVNNDGSVDHLSVIGRRAASEDGHDHLAGVAAHPISRASNPRAHLSLPPCSALAVSGVPAREQLFNGSLCDGDGSFHDMLMHPENVIPNERRRHRRKNGYEVSGALPVVVSRERSARFTGRLISHARSNSDGNLKLFDSIFAVSKGVISSYAPDGVLNWQRHDAPRWSVGNKGWALLIPPLNSDVHTAEILVVGEDTMAVVGAGGEMLATTPLAQPPNHKPIIGDFDSDGAAEVMLVSEGAIWGYTIAFAPGGSGGFRLFVAMLAGLSVASYFFHMEVSDQKKGMKLARATD